MEQKDKDQFSSEWRVKYVQALKHKQECLIQVIGTNADNHNIKRNYEIACFKIEQLELEHKIFWEQLVVNDWLERTVLYENKISKEHTEAKNNIAETIKEAKRIIMSTPVSDRWENYEKLCETVQKFDMIDFSEREILVTYYQSLKHDLSKFNK